MAAMDAFGWVTLAVFFSLAAQQDMAYVSSIDLRQIEFIIILCVVGTIKLS
jgi:hypothetical protein